MNTVENRFIAVIAIIYTVGIVGFIVPTLNPLFIKLTPFNIMAAFVIAWIFHKKWEFKHMAVIAIIGVLGWALEVLGIKTQSLFGQYYYGKTLGKGLWGVPFLMGVNWAASVFYVSSLMAGRIKNSFFAAFVCAIFLTIYDFFMEPVAMRYDFWHWKTKIIPTQNYLVWFIASLCFCWLLFATTKPIKNKMASALFLIQCGFFLCLHLYLRLF